MGNSKGIKLLLVVALPVFLMGAAWTGYSTFSKLYVKGASIFASTVSITGKTTVRNFVDAKGTTDIAPTPTTDATLTPGTYTYQVIDTYRDLEVTTVNTIATSGITAGQVFEFETSNATRDIVWAEGGNLILGAATRTQSDPADRFKVQYMGTAASGYAWKEVAFNDNN